MIETNTVFIIGAGASVPYGYPTGKELRRIICKDVGKIIKAHISRNQGTQFEDELQDFSQLLNEMKDAFFRSGTPSIDMFLSRSSSYAEVGKSAIVASILDAESSSVFHEETVIPEQDWYSYLYHRMSNELTGKDDCKRFGENKVAFITFNYDRSLEHFLSECLRYSFIDSLRYSVNIAELIPFRFIHVYGCVSDLPWQSGSGLRYGDRNDFRTVQRLTRNIRVIYDRADANLYEAKQAILDADRVFFLGFGYAKENLDVLGLPDILNNHQKVYGSAYKFTKKERNSIVNYFCQRKDCTLNNNNEKVTRKGNVWLADYDCHRLLREWL
jgi:hypothetical protein